MFVKGYYNSLRFNRIFCVFKKNQCKGISKLLLRLSTLTYYNFVFFCVLPVSRVLYVVYVSVENYVRLK